MSTIIPANIRPFQPTFISAYFITFTATFAKTYELPVVATYPTSNLPAEWTPIQSAI